LQTANPDSYDILVIDNASADIELLRSMIAEMDPGKRIQLIEEAQVGLSHARNRAVRESRSQYVFFIDDDALANPRLIEHYLKTIREHQPDIVGGNVIPLFSIQPEAEMDYTYWTQWSLKHYGDDDRWLGGDEYFIGTNMGAPRELLIKNPFDPDLGRKGDTLAGGEEWFLGDARFNKYFCAGAYVFHKVPRERMQADYLARRYLSSPQQKGRRVQTLKLILRWLKASLKDGRLFLKKAAFRATLMKKIRHHDKTR
jgi:glycosyltransferase involved in cell wall biosynthesis